MISKKSMTRNHGKMLFIKLWSSVPALLFYSALITLPRKAVGSNTIWPCLLAARWTQKCLHLVNGVLICQLMLVKFSFSLVISGNWRKIFIFLSWKSLRRNRSFNIIFFVLFYMIAYTDKKWHKIVHDHDACFYQQNKSSVFSSTLIHGFSFSSQVVEIKNEKATPHACWLM